VGSATRRFVLAGCFGAALLASSAAPATAYELDPTFGGDGIVTTDGAASGNDDINDLIVLDDGKVLVAGRMRTATARDFALARYNADGTLDQTFSDDGIVTTDISGNSGDAANAMTIQSDGKIVLAGFTFPDPEASNDEDTAIVRYNADGTLDTSFDGNSGSGNGIVTVPVSSDDDSGVDILVDGSDRIVVAGFAVNANGDDDFSIIRLSGAGVLDTAFDGPSTTGNGIVTRDISGADGFDGATAVRLLDDNDLVVGGFAFADDNDPAGFALLRLNAADGTLDTAFDGDSTTGNGTVTTNTAGALNDLVIETGKIVAAGAGVGGSFALARYNQSNGTLDNTFDGDSGTGNGLVTTPFPDANASVGALVPDGSRYVAAGSASAFSDGDESVSAARYLSDGTLDEDFGGDGLVVTNSQPPDGGENADAVGIFDDDDQAGTENKVVVGGRSEPPGDDEDLLDFALFRYRPDVTAAVSRISKPKHKEDYGASRIRTLRGTASDPNDGSGVDEVDLALRRKRNNGTCAWWDGDSFVGGDCATRVFVGGGVAGLNAWTYFLSSKLKSSVDSKFKNYTLFTRGTDVDGNEESEFDAKRNANTFDVR
jgi:uncharacterized delta-60 repeat protein